MRQAPSRNVVLALLCASTAVGAGCSERGAGESGDGAEAGAAPALEEVGEPGGTARPVTEDPGAGQEERAPTLVEALAGKADPEADDWRTEVFNTRSGGQLKALAHLLEAPAELSPQALVSLVSANFACGALRPEDLAPVREDAAASVLRPAKPLVLDSAATVFRGAEGLSAALADLLAPHAGSGHPHAKFKPFTVTEGEGEFTTRAYLEISGELEAGVLQTNATWTCRWEMPPAGSEEAPRLRWIGVEAHEEVQLHSVRGPLFRDCTESALGANAAYEQIELPGLNHWLTRISELMNMSIAGHSGLALGDVNGDGLEDLYACDSGGLPNRLYVQSPDGTLEEVAAHAGVDWLELSSAALLVDLDGDGDEDLVAATRPLLLFAENDGEGVFTVRARERAGKGPMSLSAADPDGDGDLDLYLCAYDSHPESLQVGAYPYHDANNGEPNSFWRNEGEFRFTDVTEEVGLGEHNSRFSFAAVWEDYDEDGDLDLYVANDYGRNCLYQNDGRGHFSDVAPAAGVEDIASGMSVAWGDYDRNGFMDVYVSNMFSAAGNRVTFQRRFQADNDHDDEATAGLQRMARGNTLFANTGDGTFLDVSVGEAVIMGRWAWASSFADVDNDGWEDLLVANGHITMDSADDL
ncbi:MAG: VCBS repeat-containing protein [Planctomycetota bacterium]|jgi:hypothetical protein|nr:VCBS repeat-containing protein [Planctomycetota bacterium]